MRSVNVDTVDIAVVSMGTNVQSSLLTTALLQKLGVADMFVVLISCKRIFYYRWAFYSNESNH